MTYRAPVEEHLFVLDVIGELTALGHLDVFAHVDRELASNVLIEVAKLAEDEFYPLNRVGDAEGVTFQNGHVSLPPGSVEAYRKWIEGGWNGIEAPIAAGGFGLPLTLSALVQEQIFSANVAFSQIISLTAGAARAIAAHGSEALRSTYLPKLISGAWSGTMNLTESGAGSDVGALKTSASAAGDGTYRITGEKIFITFGEHDATENIIHLVLARIKGAEAGTGGLSLFIVPKYLVSDDQKILERNDVRCTGIEHKLGMHGSATCSLAYGDQDRCVGYLVGEPHAGIRAMFTMMNHARISVGLQGVGLSEIAYQKAARYARERTQSRPIGGGPTAVRIIEHPDVRRMLMIMRAQVEASRALAIYNSHLIDRSEIAGAHRDDRLTLRAELLTPCTKAYSTDVALQVSSLAIQVFGGIGFIEEAGVAQHFRDSRILPIYEGTNGIQALDLVRRKIRLAEGHVVEEMVRDIASSLSDWQSTELLEEGRARLAGALAVFEEATRYMLESSPSDSASGATAYLKIFSLLTCGWLMGRQAFAASARLGSGEISDDFLRAKIATAKFFLTQILPEVDALRSSALVGSNMIFSVGEDQFPQ
jgi:3-(methylthio)propanoyl-CoA dehydrogenase